MIGKLFIPVVSITIWSNFPFFLLTSSDIIRTRSPLTVQQRHPLFNITMSSAPVVFAATKEPSISTSPNCSFKTKCNAKNITDKEPHDQVQKVLSHTSFSITAIRFPWSAVNIWLSNVVCKVSHESTTKKVLKFSK